MSLESLPLSQLSHIPESLHSQLQLRWQQFTQASPELAASVAQGQWLAPLLRLWACSDFACDQCIRHPQWLQALLEQAQLLQPQDPEVIAQGLAQALGSVVSEAELMQALRHYRQQQMLRILWRDINHLDRLPQTLEQLSALAESCIQQAYEYLYRQLVAQWGQPVDTHGQPLPMLVVALGKLGAAELNLSSDVDLMFVYPERGETQGGPRSVSHEQFFIRLGQQLIKVLDQVTVDGFVFRVDMRLRPFGSSGPLAISFAALEHYYQSQGREWERYALIKARAITGGEFIPQLHALWQPFVYRRYMDFGAFAALRKLKQLIRQEVKRKHLEQDIKLGAGGIREIEFIAQAFQLIYGGRTPQLQQPSLLAIFAYLAELQLLPASTVQALLQAYDFLRRLEHRLQGLADKQTQTLPQDPQTQQRIALAMNFASWSDCEAQLQQHQQQVQQHFAQVVDAEPTETLSSAATESSSTDLGWLWVQEEVEAAVATAALQQHGFSQAAEVWQRLCGLKQSRCVRQCSELARERLDTLMPRLLAAASVTAQPSQAALQLLIFIESVIRRSAYVALLAENPAALAQLARLCAASPWFAPYLARHPVLLDELLDVRTLYAPLQQADLSDQLQQSLLRVPEGDLEQQMNVLRQFKQASVLRVAAADVTGALPLMRVSDYLTAIAEVVLQQAVALVWRQVTQQYGYPPQAEGPEPKGFAVVAYGKLGGYELGYGSDLDVVFLHQWTAEDAAQGLDISTFYTRLAQKLLHVFNTRTMDGVLYELDTRLRPSGQSGMLVTRLAAFDQYQQQKAWIWEHQALVRARWVAGDPALATPFEQVRCEVLQQDYTPQSLVQEVVGMREKMRSHLGSGQQDTFDLKQDFGGVTDIEFMVQYSVLRYAAQVPELLRYTDNIRILDTLAEHNLMASADVLILKDAYQAFRARTHQLSLQNQRARVTEDAVLGYRDQVQALWQRYLLDTRPAD